MQRELAVIQYTIQPYPSPMGLIIQTLETSIIKFFQQGATTPNNIVTSAMHSYLNLVNIILCIHVVTGEQGIPIRTCYLDCKRCHTSD